MASLKNLVEKSYGANIGICTTGACHEYKPGYSLTSAAHDPNPNPGNSASVTFTVSANDAASTNAAVSGMATVTATSLTTSMNAVKAAHPYFSPLFVSTVFSVAPPSQPGPPSQSSGPNL